MTEHFDQELIKVLCPTIKPNGYKCSWFLGDFVKGKPTVQNFLCSECRHEYLVIQEKDDTNTLHFHSVPKNTPKNYDPDTLSILES
jgi:hypothetical protein